MKTIKLTDGRELVFLSTDMKLIPNEVVKFPHGVETTCIGTITGDYEADFDVEPYVYNADFDNGDGKVLYEDFTNKRMIECFCNNPKDSFKSLMNANDIWMHNNFIKPVPSIYRNLDDYNFALNVYQKAQNKVVSKYIVLMAEDK